MHGYILKHIVQNPQQSVFNFRHNDKNSLKTPTPSGEKCNPAYEKKNPQKVQILRTIAARAIYRPLATINRPSILTCEHTTKELFSLHFRLGVRVKSSLSRDSGVVGSLV